MCRWCCQGEGEACCPVCYSNWRRRSNVKGHARYRKPRNAQEDEMKRPLPKPPEPFPQEAGPTDASYSEFELKWPNLFSHLFDEVYEDASKRVTSTLLFFVERGVLKACLNDRDTGRVAFLSVQSVLDALDQVEAGLMDEGLDWRKKRTP